MQKITKIMMLSVLLFSVGTAAAASGHNEWQKPFRQSSGKAAEVPQLQLAQPIGGEMIGGEPVDPSETLGGEMVGGEPVNPSETLGGRMIGGEPVNPSETLGGRMIGGEPVAGEPVGGPDMTGEPVY